MMVVMMGGGYCEEREMLKRVKRKHSIPTPQTSSPRNTSDNLQFLLQRWGRLLRICISNRFPHGTGSLCQWANPQSKHLFRMKNLLRRFQFCGFQILQPTKFVLLVYMCGCPTTFMSMFNVQFMCGVSSTFMAMCMPGTRGGQKKVLESLVLEVQIPAQHRILPHFLSVLTMFDNSPAPTWQLPTVRTSNSEDSLLPSVGMRQVCEHPTQTQVQQGTHTHKHSYNKFLKIRH